MINISLQSKISKAIENNPNYIYCGWDFINNDVPHIMKVVKNKYFFGIFTFSTVERVAYIYDNSIRCSDYALAQIIDNKYPEIKIIMVP